VITQGSAEEGGASWRSSVSIILWGLYRDERTLEAISYYNKLSGAEPVETAFVLDPMIATGGTAICTVNTLRTWGVRRIKLLGILASEEGLQRLEEADPDLQVYVCAVDPLLNERGYIVPGLGDAGDRQFGTGWGKEV
jgi:uracil phosphoribosyltransferase